MKKIELDKNIHIQILSSQTLISFLFVDNGGTCVEQKSNDKGHFHDFVLTTIFLKSSIDFFFFT